MTAKPRPLPMLLLALVCLIAAACGGSGGSGGSGDEPAAATTTTPAGPTAAATQACTDAAAVKASVTRLDQLDPPEVGKAGLQAALQDLRTSLAGLQGSAEPGLAAQAGQLDTAVGSFQTTVAGFDGDNLLAELPTIVSNLERIDTAWTALEREIDQACPSP